MMLEGLSTRQVVLADLLWLCGDRSSVEQLIAALPTREIQQEAQTLVNLMIVTAVDQAYDGRGSLDEAQSIIRNISK